MKKLLIITLFTILASCGIFKTHHKDKLINFKNNLIPPTTLKLDGYYYTELERDAQIFDKILGVKIKYLSAFFIYEDGFVINIPGVDGLTTYSCARYKTFENTYESAHKAIELMLESQYSTERRTKRICGFKPNHVGNKGLVKIENDSIKIQTYRIEYQSTPGAGNSAYLYELNGTIQSDSVFMINSETRFRTNKITLENAVFKFRQTKKKPNIENYFKTNINRFK